MKPVRPEAPHPLRHLVPGASGGSTDLPLRPVERIERTDRVQISDAGRRLAEQLAPVHTGGRLSESRVQEIRLRIDAGVYDRADVIEIVARRLLERGDV